MIIYQSWTDWPRLVSELSKANREKLLQKALSDAMRKEPADLKNKAPAGRGAGRGQNE
jgi:hypothetical protein